MQQLDEVGKQNIFWFFYFLSNSSAKNYQNVKVISSQTSDIFRHELSKNTDLNYVVNKIKKSVFL